MQELRHSALKCLFEEKLVLLMLMMMMRRRIQWAQLARCKMSKKTYHDHCNDADADYLMAVEMMLMMTTKVAELVSDENLMHVWEAASMRCLLCAQLLGRVCLLCLCSQLLLLCASSAPLILISAESLCSLCLCSSAQQSLFLLYASSAQPPLPIGEEESNIGVQSWASPARVYKMIWYSQFSTTEPTWTQLEHFSHVGGVGGAVHNRGGGILHFSFVIQTDGRVVFFHNPEQAMAEHFFFINQTNDRAVFCSVSHISDLVVQSRCIRSVLFVSTCNPPQHLGAPQSSL